MKKWLILPYLFIGTAQAQTVKIPVKAELIETALLDEVETACESLQKNLEANSISLFADSTWSVALGASNSIYLSSFKRIDVSKTFLRFTMQDSVIYIERKAAVDPVFSFIEIHMNGTIGRRNLKKLDLLQADMYRKCLGESYPAHVRIYTNPECTGIYSRDSFMTYGIYPTAGDDGSSGIPYSADRFMGQVLNYELDTTATGYAFRLKSAGFSFLAPIGTMQLTLTSFYITPADYQKILGTQADLWSYLSTMLLKYHMTKGW